MILVQQPPVFQLKKKEKKKEKKGSQKMWLSRVQTVKNTPCFLAGAHLILMQALRVCAYFIQTV